MKKNFTLLLLALSALTAGARQLSPAEALQRAGQDQLTPLSVKTVASPQLVMDVKAAKTNIPAVYVFDTKPGYLILSANDCAAPVLGYSDRGTIDPQSLPPAMKYWLDSYASQIAWAEQNGVTYNAKSASRATDMEAIAPLVKTTWNQSAPYNDKCPEFNGERSVTGCVATALAQEMYYHQWPATAQGGKVSYESEYSSEYTTQISLNFDNVTFDWNDMLLNYTSDNYTTTQADAVAELMYACGVAVEMDYSPVESGASTLYIAPALYKYFGYSDAAIMPFRTFYTSDEWNQMVYDQLAQNLPVLYGGDSTEGGHQFVCDGYQGDGYFHFNWGWAGQSDGYYLLSALDPESQGIGGSTSGYNYNQSICINVAKPGVITGPQYLIYCSGDFLTEGLYENMEEEGSSQTVQLGQTLTIMSSNYFGNYGCKAVDGAFGILISGDNGTTTAYASSTSLATLADNGDVQSYTVTLPSTLEEGTYNVTPIFLPEGASEYVNILAPVAGIRSLSMTVSGSTATITVGNAPDFTISNAEFKSEVYSGSYFSLDFTAVNNGSDQYYGLIGAVLVQNGNEMASTEQVVPVTLNAGETATFNLIGQFENELGDGVAAGEYQVVLVESTTGNSVGPQNSLTVNVQSTLESSPTLNVSLAIDGTSTDVDPSDITFKGTVGVESGYLADQLMMFVFPDESGAEDIYYTYTDYMFVGEGDQTDFDLNVDLSSVVTDGGTYMAQMYTSSEEALGQPVTFTVQTTGISDVADTSADVKVFPIPANDYITVTAPEGIGSVAIVNLAGQAVRKLDGANQQSVTVNVDNLASGHYFLVITSANGKNTARHIIVE